MAGLNVEWATTQLDQFLLLTKQVRFDDTPGVAVFGTHYRGSEEEIAGAAQVVEQILDRVLPLWRSEKPEPSGHAATRWSALREMAARARQQLERQEELHRNLGDNAPALDASHLHPWVWEPARSLWHSGHFAAAVQAASVRVNAETQIKVDRRDVGEVSLYQQAFSTDLPASGKARLRIVPDDGSPTTASRQRGARALGEALFSGLRNPLAHDGVDELDEHLALEQLAAFSLLARWVDESAVIRE